jgi:hypothetical protein
MTFRSMVPLVLVGLATGCAGARATVRADHARYPISMSSEVRDQSGKVHGHATLQQVGHFEAETSRIGIFYSILTIPGSFDISDEVNQQVAAAGGEAVVRLNVSVSPGCDLLNGMPVLNMLPLWPGCVPITVEGDIVKRKPTPVAPPAPAAPAAPALVPPSGPVARPRAPRRRRRPIARCSAQRALRRRI